MIKKEKRKTYNKLVIIAHPDDELIFYGSHLIRDNNNKVICLTNANNSRYNEFKKLMTKLDCGYIIMDHKDDSRIKHIKPEYKDYLYRYIKTNKHKLKRITTHNVLGEYGHNFHKAISEVVYTICRDLKLLHKLYYFSFSKRKLSDSIIKEKYELMKEYYPSQYKVLDKLEIKQYMENESSIQHLKNICRK